MPDPVSAMIATAGTTLIGGAMQSSAARSAAQTQARAAERGAELQAEAQRQAIEEQRRQFERISEILQPYVAAGQTGITGLAPFRQAGATAFERQQALLGLRGPEAEAAEIAAIQRRPGFLAQQQEGERALLRRAGATGGLRGGAVQRALAQFSPALLGREIEAQYGRLGGLAGAGLGIEERLATLGQASAARTGAAAGGLGANVANLLTGGAAEQSAAMQTAARAQAAGQLGQVQAFAPALNLPGQLLGYQLTTGQPLFGGGQQPAAPIVEAGPAIPGAGAMGTALPPPVIGLPGY